jgi:hypothetical protein
MTWTITPSEFLAETNPVSDAFDRSYDAFSETLDIDLTLKEILPFYVGRLPNYPRLFASALSRSICGTVILGGQESSRCRDWQLLLPRLESVHLLYEDSTD